MNSPLPPIRFAELAKALLDDADSLVGKWLPGGTKRGHEWVCGSLSGGEGGSCSVNLTNGRWADFQAGEQGGDLLALYATIHGLSPGKAAAQVAREEGLEQVAGLVHTGAAGPAPAPPRPPRPPAQPAKAEPESWVTVVPVPAHAVQPTFKHHHRRPEDIEHTATYRQGDVVYGYVVRFRTSDGGKDTLPYTWCQSERDGAARWHWRQWDEPRPLFLPAGRVPDGRTVVLVEGERKAEALQDLLDVGAPGVYCVATWPGGGKAWKKADWTWLAGATVLLWPDCDSKLEPLTPAERKANPDKTAQLVIAQAKPLLPAHKQPGNQAMHAIGAALRDAHACTVQLLAIPPPGQVVDGWDCRDAIVTDGWDFDRVLTFFATAAALPADASAGPPAAAGGGGDGGKKPRDPPAEAGDGSDAFSDYLWFVANQLEVQVHQLQPNRKMIVAALRKAPALVDCLAFDELRGSPCTREPWPWRDKAAPLVDQDDLRLGDYLEQTYKVKSPSRAALAEAIESVADERRYHPIRNWLEDLKHDGKPRLEKWLIHVLGHDPATLEPKFKRYLELVGKFILLGQVYRVMEPGCKFDYSVVFEGITGMGKSTIVRALVGEEFFSDTHFDIGSGNKDGMEQLAGIWAYELSEMTAFRRADSESVKQFFSTQKDRYRGAYGRYVQDHPRQCVIWCTTNKRQYLFDVTGNRRFWPVWVQTMLNVEWLRKWRHQLFAEAMAMYRKGERNYPTPDEERLYFKPEQEKRLVETSVQSRLFDLLTRPGAGAQEGKATVGLNEHTAFLTVADLVTALGTDPGKSSTMLEGQIRDWLLESGWTAGREPGGQRRRGYFKPDEWPPKFEEVPVPPELGGGNEEQQADDGAAAAGGRDDEPF